MAIDWIKMRTNLQTHPKVVRMLSALRSDKFRVVGGLHAVWGVFDAHSADGILDGYTPETLDHIIGWEGFAQAMISVGWLVDANGEGLMLPDFDEHNSQSGKRRAEDQKRKRDARKIQNESDVDADDSRTKSGQKADQIRKEKNTTSSLRSEVVGIADLVAGGVSELHANAWLQVRKAHRAPLTPVAWKAVVREAGDAGISLDDAVRISAENSWRGFRADWYANLKARPGGKAGSRQQELEDRNRTVARKWAGKGHPQGDGGHAGV